jgi:hypothetical protein
MEKRDEREEETSNKSYFKFKYVGKKSTYFTEI